MYRFVNGRPERDPEGPSFPNCENPQRVFASASDEAAGMLLRPCGHCFSCRRRRANVKEGVMVSELRRPLHEAHGLPGASVWLTLTYPDSALPWTDPEPHDLSLNSSQDRPFAGPFVRPELRGGRPKPRVFSEGGESAAYWLDAGPAGLPRRLTAAELAAEQVLYLRHIVGWSDSQIGEWQDGSYDSVPTLDRADLSNYLKRLRAHHAFNYPDEPGLRFAAAGEYGDLLGRPHFHLLLWGFGQRPADVRAMYRAWQRHQDEAIVHPPLDRALHHGALSPSVNKAVAAYQAKDLVKSRQELLATPALAARVPGYVAQSDRPPLGVSQCEHWLRTVVIPAMESAGPDALARCVAARRVMLTFQVSVEGSVRQYITSRWWREQVRQGFADDVWAEATAVLVDEIVREQGLGDAERESMLHEHRGAVVAKNRELEGLGKKRKRAKARALRSVPRAVQSGVVL